MLRLDTVKLKAPISTVKGFSDRFIDTQISDGSGLILSQKKALTRTNLSGFKSAISDGSDIILELSAKVLKSGYIEGLNKNTIQQAIESVNRTNLINLEVNQFIDSAEVLRCDVTNNIKPDVLNEVFYKTLAALPIAKKYHVDLYNTIRNQGVVWKGNQKTVRDRIIFYDKQKDILRDKELRTSPYANKIYNDFKGVVRVESNHSQFKALNKLFGNRAITEVLNSSTKVNYNVFNRITEKTNDIDLKLFGEFEGMKFNEIRKYLGDRGIIQMCNYDWQSIELFIKAFNQNNYRAYKKELKPIYNSMVSKQNNLDLNIIQHVKDLLNNAA